MGKSSHTQKKRILKVSGTINTNLYFVVSGTLRIYTIEEQEEHIIRFGYKNNLLPHWILLSARKCLIFTFNN